MADKKRFSLISNDSNNLLLLSKVKSNISDFSKFAEQIKMKVSGNKSFKAMMILKSILTDFNDSFSKLPELSKVKDRISEALDILSKEDEYWDESILETDSEKSEEMTQALDLLKSYSNTYTHEIKTNNLKEISKSSSKFTQKGFNLKKMEKLKLESIPETQDEKDTQFKKPNLKRFSEAIKTSEKINKIFTFDFNIFEIDDLLKEKTLPVVSSNVFRHLNFFEIKLINEKEFFTFAEALASGYSRSVPYHNDLHAVDVFQTIFNFFNKTEIDDVFLIKFNLI